MQFLSSSSAGLPTAAISYVLEASHTSRRIFTHPVNGDTAQLIDSGPGENTDVSLCKRGNVMAFVHQETEKPPEIYMSGTTRFKPSRLTDVNAGLARLPMGKTDVITWKSNDGLEIEGLLTYPVNYVKGEALPARTECPRRPHELLFADLHRDKHDFTLSSRSHRRGTLSFSRIHAGAPGMAGISSWVITTTGDSAIMRI